MRVIWKVAMLAVTVLIQLGLGGHGATAAVVHSGQSRCYDDQAEIPCPAPGEPFYGQDGNYYPGTPAHYSKLDASGAVLPPEATVNDGWVATRDENTGLVWQIWPGEIGFFTAKLSWCDPDPLTNGGYEGWCPGGTYDFLRQLNGALDDPALAGRTDWRLPTIEEVVGILDLGWDGSGPSFNSDAFPNMQGLNYLWTGQTVPDDPTTQVNENELAFKAGVAFAPGVNLVDRDNKLNTNNVLAVAGTSPGHDFQDNGDGTITDTATGLMWAKDLLAGDYTWQAALETAEGSTLAGYDDWRLPSVKEWAGLLDLSRSKPATPAVFTDPSWVTVVWTATTYAHAPTQAWQVWLHNGLISPKTKTTLAKIRLVRTIPREVLPGDVDGSGVVDLTDALILARIFAGLDLPPGTVVEKTAALDGSGRLSPGDLAGILALLVH